jgi:hypothetical protein
MVMPDRLLTWTQVDEFLARMLPASSPGVHAAV